MRTVKDILGSKIKTFNIVSPHTLVIDALSMLNSVNLSYLIVMDNNEYKGIFSERDYSRNVILKGRTSRSSTVQEVMTTDLPMVHLDQTVEHCMKTMILNKTRYLLAFDSNKNFAGVVTIHDLLREVIANKEQIFDTETAQELLNQDEGGYIY
ncbi:MAG TPA: CBS domain-containing protein [Flavisolibacter sp.]|jgi:CBS domain-containing protein|nr:CBS domain-containing protein [Flavisolibacter sp.]